LASCSDFDFLEGGVFLAIWDGHLLSFCISLGPAPSISLPVSGLNSSLSFLAISQFFDLGGAGISSIVYRLHPFLRSPILLYLCYLYFGQKRRKVMNGCQLIHNILILHSTTTFVSRRPNRTRRYQLYKLPLPIILPPSLTMPQHLLLHSVYSSRNPQG